MKIKKQYLIIILTFLFLLLGTTISFGAYSASSSTVESEGKVTVKVTSSEALDAYNLDLSNSGGLTFNSCSKIETGAIININGSSIGYMNMSGNTKELGIYNFTAPKVTKDTDYTISFLVDRKTTVTSKITVKAPVVETPKEPETPVQEPVTSTPEPEKPSATETKSSEARLSNFGIKPNDFSGFKKDKTEYSVEVPNSVAEVEVYATAVDSKAKISGTGKVTLKEGNNTVKVTVTAEDGKTTKTYTLTIKRKTAAEETEIAGEARLKNLGIKPEEYDFSGFNSENTQYSVEVPNEIDEIEVYATAMSSKAQITGTGMIELKEGKNELKIGVIAEDGTKKEYTLEVTRKESEEVVGTTVEKFGLSILSTQGLKLSPSFNVEKYEYTVELNEDISSLNIQAKANEENATVEIIGNENLQQGENTITILVTNKETLEVVTYQIIVNKNVNVTVDEVEQMSWLKPSTWGKEEKIKLAIIIVLIVLIISAIILKISIGKQENQVEEKEFPGADELDRAIAENQELSTEQDIAKDRFAVEDDLEVRPKRRGKHF